MVKVNNIRIGDNNPFVLIAGPCLVESKELVEKIASEIKKITTELDIPFIFKSSYKKANRTSGNSFSGIGDKEALRILSGIKENFGLPVLTDIHTIEEGKNR